MLEDFINPSAAERLRSGIFRDHVEELCRHLVALGYSPATIRSQLWTVGALARWMAAQDLAATDLDEACVADFVGTRQARRLTCRGWLRTGLMLIEQLRCAGVIRTPESLSDDSPFAAVIALYRAHLCQGRAVTMGTTSRYVMIARMFLNESLHELDARVESLSAKHVRDFQLSRAGREKPKQAQFVGSALRSFLRFLLACDKIGNDLALAVLSVRQQRRSKVPRHMSSEDVERLLRSCDRLSATGRRNHAILLLLARLGLRASEVIALKLDDLRWRDGEIVVRGKGLIRDRVPLLPDIGEALVLYLKNDRPRVASRCVFLCRRAPHRGLGHPSTVSTIVMRALVRAGLSPATHGAHLLRHSLATTMVRRGASFTEIGQVLRHRSPNTTEIYAKLDFGVLRDIALPWPTSRGAQ